MANEWLYYPRDSPSAGFLNVREIYRRHPDANCFCIVGARQTGKTYGTLDLLHELQTPFIYMRLTEEERLQALSGKSNLFTAKQFPWGEQMEIDDGKICYCYDSEFYEGKKPLIMATSLAKLNHMRGYAGDEYDHILLDEFIPMKEAYKRKGYGKTLADAYMTINSVRELKGKQAVKLWLLANSNDLSADILVYFDLVTPLLRMQKRGQNYCYLPERGIVLINLYDSPVSDRLKKTALFRMLGNNAFSYADCAIANEFADDDQKGVKSVPLKEVTPVCCFDGFNVYKAKQGNYTYIARGAKPLDPYFDTRNPTHLKAFLELWVSRCCLIPVDGVNIFYGEYAAKLAVYGALRLDKVR